MSLRVSSIVKFFRSIVVPEMIIRKQLSRRGIAIGKDCYISRDSIFKTPGLRRECITIGERVHFTGKLSVVGNGRIRIGNHCSFRSNTFIGSLESIEIGSHVFGAENVFITDNNNHPTSPKLRLEMTLTPPNSPKWKWDTKGVESSPVVIGDNVWLGRNSVILKGVNVGEGSIVAAGAVVTKTVPSYCVVAGNPARVVKRIVNDIV